MIDGVTLAILVVLFLQAITKELGIKLEFFSLEETINKKRK